MDFSTIPKAGEGAQSHEKEGKEERKEKKGLPQALTASSAPIFSEHGYGRPRLQLEKNKEKGERERPVIIVGY